MVESIKVTKFIYFGVFSCNCWCFSTGDCIPMPWRGSHCCLAVLCWWRCMWRHLPIDEDIVFILFYFFIFIYGCVWFFFYNEWLFISKKNQYEFNVFCRSEGWVFLHCDLGMPCWWNAFCSGRRTQWHTPCHWCWRRENTQGFLFTQFDIFCFVLGSSCRTKAVLEIVVAVTVCCQEMTQVGFFIVTPYLGGTLLPLTLPFFIYN